MSGDDLAAEELRARGYTVWSPEERRGLVDLGIVLLSGVWLGLVLGAGRG